MGLNMYLVGKLDISPSCTETKPILKALNKHFDDPNLHVNGLSFKLAYWRDVHVIHGWFVDIVQASVDRGGEYYVPWEQLEELIQECKAALNGDESILEPEKCSTEDRAWYFEDLKDTIRQCEMALVLAEKYDLDLYYHSSW